MKVFKTMIICLTASLSSLFVPMFAQWYKQTTGIDPIAFYFISFFAGCTMVGVSLYNVWNDEQ